MQRRTIGVVLVAALVLAVAPSLAAAEPGFAPVRLMPTILGVPSTTMEAYSSVSCPTQRSCTVVGPGFLINSQMFSPLARPTAITESGGTWGVRTALPLPGNEVASTTTSPGVSSVTCAAVADCTAVGSYPIGAGMLAPLVETEVAGSWTASSVVLPGGVTGTAELTSVWCASSTSCVALGVFQATGQSAAPMVAEETAGSWGRAVALPAYPGGGGSLPFSIACSRTGTCVAVAVGGQSVASTVAWREHGGAWGSPVALRQPRSLQFLGISVACPTTTTCLIGGGLLPTGTSSQAMFPAVVTETSGAWSMPRLLREPTLTPVLTEGLVTSITCPTHTTCEAVGGFLSRASAGRARPGAYTWSKGRWSSPGMIRGVPLGKTMAYQSYFSAVSCASASTCLAIGPVRKGLGKHTLSSAFFASITPVRSTTVPSRPTSVAVRAEPHGAVIRWGPPIDDGGAPVSRYTVMILPGGERCTTARDACDVGRLEAGHRYRATVTVSTAIGSSAPTVPIAFVPQR